MSLREFGAGLLGNHIFGIPDRPLLIADTTVPLFVLAVCCRRPNQRVLQIRPGRKRSGRRIDSSGNSLCYFLKHPAVAVEIVKRSGRPIALTLRVKSALLPCGV